MKEKIIPSVASAILGLMLLFFSINLFQSTFGGYIALGVFGLIFGLIYILLGLVAISPKQIGSVELQKLLTIIATLLFPTFIFIQIIVTMAAIGAGAIAPAGWVMDIWLLLIIALLLTAGVFSILKVSKRILLIKDFLLVLFSASYCLLFAFSQAGGLVTIGNLSVYEIVVFASFLVIAFFASRSNLQMAAEKITSLYEEKPEEAPKEEEPKQEEPGEEEPGPEEPEIPENEPQE